MSLGQVDNPSLFDIAGGELPPVLAPAYPVLATHYGDPGLLPITAITGFDPYISVGDVDAQFQVAGTSYGYKNNLDQSSGIADWIKNNKMIVYATVGTVVALTLFKGK